MHPYTTQNITYLSLPPLHQHFPPCFPLRHIRIFMYRQFKSCSLMPLIINYGLGERLSRIRGASERALRGIARQEVLLCPPRKVFVVPTGKSKMRACEKCRLLKTEEQVLPPYMQWRSSKRCENCREFK